MKTTQQATEALFVVSHMRSYSTLLAHILASNPDIVGWKERHQSYPDRRALQRLTASAPEARYVVDKVLHSGYRFGDGALAGDEGRYLISIRHPKATLQSMWRWGGPKQRFKVPGAAADYYCNRLDALAELGARLAGRFALLRADRLVTHTDTTLERLSEFLELSTPLHPEYTVTPDTGTPGMGDFSRHITSGVIKPSRRRKANADVPADDIARARAARKDAVGRLKQLCAVTI